MDVVGNDKRSKDCKEQPNRRRAKWAMSSEPPYPEYLDGGADRTGERDCRHESCRVQRLRVSRYRDSVGDFLQCRGLDLDWMFFGAGRYMVLAGPEEVCVVAGAKPGQVVVVTGASAGIGQAVTDVEAAGAGP